MTDLRPPEPLQVGDNAAASWQTFKQRIELYLIATEPTKPRSVTFARSLLTDSLTSPCASAPFQTCHGSNRLAEKGVQVVKRLLGKTVSKKGDFYLGLLNYREGRCAYCILLVFEFWALNVIPAPVASSVPCVLLPLLGVMDPDLVAAHYMNETMLFIVGVVLLALAMEGTNIYSRVALAILGACGAGVKAVFTALMALAFCATLLFENVLSTLIVMPVVECTMVEIENDALTSATRRRMLRRASVMARLTNQQPEPCDQPPLQALAASASQPIGPGPMTQMSRRSSRGSRGSRDIMWTPDSGMSSAYARGALGCRKRSSVISLEFAAKFEQEAQKYLLIRRVLLLSVAYSATLGAVGSVFGNPASRVLRMVLEERYSYDRLTMMSWLVICLPISAAGILACWMVVFVVFLKEYDCEEDDETKESIAKILEEKYHALGRFSKLEYFVMACILGLFLVLLLRSEFATPFAVPEEFGLL
nr:sodium-dependent low-affinity dicarboxylate transporter 1-like [Dermacentor andersoni]